MDISARLAASLTVLTEALDDPEIDLEAELRRFTTDLKRAVDSYVAMTMIIAADSHAVSFAVHEDVTSAPATSLLIPLAEVSAADTRSTLLLFAARPGAFVDLAADLSFALGIDPAALVLDDHLDPGLRDPAALSGLDAHAAINQAIGVLIGNGHTPESARHELQRLARTDHDDLRAAAEAVIRGAHGGSPGPHGGHAGQTEEDFA